MLNMVIIDDNYKFVESLFNQLNIKLTNKYIITKICTDTTNIIDYLIKSSIDVILLDLNMPNINGLKIIDALNENNIKSEIIVISGESQLIFKLVKNNYNIYKIFLKPFNCEDLIDTLIELYNYSTTKASEVHKKLDKILNSFNFNKSSIGYTYILDILEICIEKQDTYIHNLTNLYTEVAKKYNLVNVENIRWNVDKCISSMKKSTQKSELDQISSFYVSTKTFLSIILDRYYNY